ncbi:sensor histidine kinase [Plantactinospora sp. CA-290183]|uniref:sensor histidine kinase n=1 Tax=Plantactinospora sp. CA-290183 TaxID=3240006 RepID=UPI003D8E0D5A
MGHRQVRERSPDEGARGTANNRDRGELAVIRLRWRRKQDGDPTAARQPVSGSLHGDTPRLSAAPLGTDIGHEPWRVLCGDTALRLLNVLQQMSVTLDRAQRDQDDPDVLDALYALDQLTCRGRRTAENLSVLSGHLPPDSDRQVTSIADLITAARGRIPGWDRVTVGRVADIAVAECASGDVIRIMTELLGNAVRYTPPTGTITVSGHLLFDGTVLLRIEDEGIGLTISDLSRLNAIVRGPGSTVSAPAPLTVRGSVQQGLQVVGRVARTHGIRVTLGARRPQGTTAQVHVPAALICEIPTDHHNALHGGYDDLSPRAPGPGPPAPASAPRPAAPPVVGGEGPRRVPHTSSERPGGGPEPLPTRVPQRVRDAHPATPAPTQRAHAEDGLADAVDDLTAFNAATDTEGPTHDDS